MERLRRWWWVPGVVALVVLAAMFAAAPRYNDAQVAGSAGEFRSVVEESVGTGRFRLAASLDVLFALAYAALAVALGAGRGRVAAVGVGLVLIGATADVIENALVLANLARIDELTDDMVSTMGFWGPPKWTAGLVGAALIGVSLLLGRRNAST